MYKVAVTTKHGTMVDTHYGHAERFHVFKTDGGSSRLVEIRECQKYCLGEVDCDEAADKKRSAIESIADCDAVLTMRIGDEARRRLREAGVAVIERCISVEEGLPYAVRQLIEDAEE